MKSKLNDKQFVCVFALEHMPDSTDDRRRLLAGVRAILPKGDEVRILAMAMAESLKAFDETQRQLCLDFGGNGHDRDGGGK